MRGVMPKDLWPIYICLLSKLVEVAITDVPTGGDIYNYRNLCLFKHSD